MGSALSVTNVQEKLEQLIGADASV